MEYGGFEKVKSWPSSLPATLLQVPNPAKSPWHTAEKWHQLISIHEPFTWALFCLRQSVIQTETWLFGFLQTAVLSPLYTHNCWCMKLCHSHTLLSCKAFIQQSTINLNSSLKFCHKFSISVKSVVLSFFLSFKENVFIWISNYKQYIILLSNQRSWFFHCRAWILSSSSSLISLPRGQCRPRFSSSFDFAMWRHLSIFQISHFGANDPLEGGNFYNMAILPFPSWLSTDSLPCRRSKFNWKAAFQVIPQLYNYTGDACLHVAPFAPIYCTFCTV